MGCPSCSAATAVSKCGPDARALETCGRCELPRRTPPASRALSCRSTDRPLVDTRAHPISRTRSALPPCAPEPTHLVARHSRENRRTAEIRHFHPCGHSRQSNDGVLRRLPETAHGLRDRHLLPPILRSDESLIAQAVPLYLPIAVRASNHLRVLCSAGAAWVFFWVGWLRTQYGSDPANGCSLGPRLLAAD